MINWTIDIAESAFPKWLSKEEKERQIKECLTKYESGKPTTNEGKNERINRVEILKQILEKETLNQENIL